MNIYTPINFEATAPQVKNEDQVPESKVYITDSNQQVPPAKPCGRGPTHEMELDRQSPGFVPMSPARHLAAPSPLLPPRILDVAVIVEDMVVVASACRESRGAKKKAPRRAPVGPSSA